MTDTSNFPEVVDCGRAVLRPFAREHLTERYVGWLNDPETVRFSEQRYRRHTIESCREYVKTVCLEGNWMVAIHAGPDAGVSEGAHVGNLSVYFDWRNRVADVAILVGERAVWGRGVGAAAWLGVCRTVFQRTETEKITAGTLEKNLGMLRVMRKTGMVADGRRVKQNVWEDERADVIYCAFFREMFDRRSENGMFELAYE